jgi:short-subunit dehydrogenase
MVDGVQESQMAARHTRVSVDFFFQGQRKLNLIIPVRRTELVVLKSLAHVCCVECSVCKPDAFSPDLEDDMTVEEVHDDMTEEAREMSTLIYNKGY